MKCPNCGSEVRESDNYCSHCGKPLKTEAHQTSLTPTIVLIALVLAFLLFLAFWALPAFWTPYWVPWHCPMHGWWSTYGTPGILLNFIAYISVLVLLALFLAALLPYLSRRIR
ncbi:MAG: zinc ribbon domain-containing protein [Thermofilaceae archaeon]